jgi:CubicO group peptidase (beta-lactamase class C family)
VRRRWAGDGDDRGAPELDIAIKAAAVSTGGLSAERLSRLDDVLTGNIERGAVPGLVALVSRKGAVHVHVAGSKSIGGPPMRRDTIFRISSMTKPVTAVAAMILVEECKLRLDEPVDSLLPELAERRVLKRIEGPVEETVPANRPITVRDLLTFRMGLGYLFPMEQIPIHRAVADLGLGPGAPRPSADPAPGEFMRRLGTLPLICQPGERWLYNTPAEVLSVLVARVSGQAFDVFLRERLFEPLGMKDTGFSVPPAELDRLATSYMPNWQSGTLEVYDPAEGGDWSHPPAFANGAGGLVSTADDYLSFAQMLMGSGRHGKVRILSRSSVELMTADQLTPEQRTTSGFGPEFFADHGWGFCLYIVTRRTQLSSVGSYGWGGGMGTLWENDPSEEMITILMTQTGQASATPSGVFVDFPTLAYAAIDD